jgi:exopolysaccharide transport family protein
MLQSNALQNEFRPSMGDAPRNQVDGGIGTLVHFVIAFLRRRYLSIGLGAAISVAGCMGYLALTPPTYSAQVQVLLGNSKPQFIQQQSILTEPAFDYSQFETQVQIFKSPAIAADVIDRLKLAEDPDFREPRPLPGSSFWRMLRSHLSPAPKAPAPDGQIDPKEALISAFQSRISVSRVGGSNLVEIGFSSSSPTRAADIANAIAEAFMADQVRAKSEVNRSATSWMQERLRNLNEQALAAERAVDAYKSKNNVVSAGGKPIGDQQISELNSRLVAARAQTSEAAAKLSRYEAILANDASDKVSIGGLDAAGPEALTSPIINNLRQQYLEMERRMNEWSTRFGRDHYAVIMLKARMREVRLSILEELKRYAETSRSELEVAKQRQLEIEKQLADAVSQAQSANLAELTIRELDSNAKGLRSLYETFLQRYMGSVQQETFPIPDARVMYAAVPPTSKSKPKSTLIMILGLLAGAGMGAGLGLLKDALDGVFRTPTQMEAALGLPCLALVPSIRSTRMKSIHGSRESDPNPKLRTVATGATFQRAITVQSSSRYAEAIRSIKFAIDLNLTQASNQVIGITSALPNEGKTTIAGSLAQLIAQCGKSVVIVDCDLRNPSLTSRLAASATAGIVEIVNGVRTIEETIWRDPTTNLSVLPAAGKGPTSHTSEILSDASMRSLFDRLRSRYDYIIVDLPPLAPLIDVRSTTAFVDCYVLVVEWGVTKMDVVQHALHTAPNIREYLLGAVLNKTDIKAMTRYHGSCRDYYRDDHYVRYGVSA